MTWLEREGTFQVQVIDCGVKETDSGAVMVNFQFNVLRQWDGEQWGEDWAFGYECRGAFCLVKKDGALMEDQVKRLVEALGWSGALVELQDGSMNGRMCQIDVKGEEYQGKTYYKATWIRPFDAVPGGGGIAKLEDGRLAQLQARFGGQIRSLAGPVAGTPAPPKRPARNVAAAVMAENPPPPPIGTTMDPTDTRTNPHALPADDFPDL